MILAPLKLLLCRVEGHPLGPPAINTQDRTPQTALTSF